MNLKKLALYGVLFFLLSFVLGVSAMYYALKRAFYNKVVYLSKDSPIITLPIPSACLRFHYNISCTSSSPFEVHMRLFNKNRTSLGLLSIEGNLSTFSSGDRILDAPCDNIRFVLMRGRSIHCRLMFSYYKNNLEVLAFLVIFQLIASLIAVSLAISWFVKKLRPTDDLSLEGSINKLNL